MNIYNKLIRDRIDEVIENDGKIAHTRILDEAEYKTELKKKLKEEAEELLDASEADVLNELADVVEVLEHIMDAYGISAEILRESQRDKALSKGKFARRLFLISVEDKE